MTASIGWRPQDIKTHSLPEALKFALREGGIDGTWAFDQSSVGFFQGLRAAKVAGAQEVLDAIEKYGTIVIEWEY